MPRRRESDYPGAWWHVTNRGIAKRSTFESGLDMDAFLGLLAEQVDAGRIEVHAYAVLTTHVHLLVRSPKGALPKAMQAVFRGYVGWFNRSRKRDGSLFRGRYKARLIEDWAYWENTLRYIDLNPVSARMCRRPSDYAYGSARHYVADDRPTWLSTTDVEDVVAGCAAGHVFRRADYDEFALSVDDELLRELVEPGLEGRSHARTVPLTDLIRAASRRQRGWFEWKARLADGTTAGAVVVPATVVDGVLRRVPPVLRDRTELRAGLLRELSGLRLVDIASRLGCSVTSAHRAAARHVTRCEGDRPYREVVARLVDMAVRRSLPCPRRNTPLGRRPPELAAV